VEGLEVINLNGRGIINNFLCHLLRRGGGQFRGGNIKLLF